MDANQSAFTVKGYLQWVCTTDFNVIWILNMEINFYFNTSEKNPFGRYYLKWETEEQRKFWGHKWAFQIYFLWFELEIIKI